MDGQIRTSRHRIAFLNGHCTRSYIKIHILFGCLVSFMWRLSIFYCIFKMGNFYCIYINLYHEVYFECLVNVNCQLV